MPPELFKNLKYTKRKRDKNINTKIHENIIIIKSQYIIKNKQKYETAQKHEN